MSKHRHLPRLTHLTLIVGFLMMTAAGAGQVNSTKPGAAAERHLSADQPARQWALDTKGTEDLKRVKVCRVETVCKMRFKEGETPRTRVRNLVAPMRYEDETTPISEDFTRQVRQGFDNLKDNRGVKVRFIGYTDDAPLSGREEQNYGDAQSLSKAMAQRAAQEIQDTLGLPASAVESDGRGTSHPRASNETPAGRAMNRRIEAEFWYDDPLRELSEEPQLCPDDSEEMITRTYDAPWGRIPTIELENGQPIIPPDLAAILRRALTDIADKKNARLRFVGFTKNERLDRRTASVYSDDIGLSAARARRARDIVMKDPLLAGAKSEHEGRGYVQSDDVVNAGFIQGRESFVRVQVVYDEALPLDKYDGIEITRLTRELSPKNPYELNVMHITVDGKPIDDPERGSSDVQRCTDVALDDAHIQFRFDNLQSRRRLAVAAHPIVVALNDLTNSTASSTPSNAPSVVHFRMYNNYSSFIDHSEIRIFEEPQSIDGSPMQVIALDEDGLADWQPSAETLSGPARQLKYLLRAYDAKGNFDETDVRPLWLSRDATMAADADKSASEILAAYGESDLARRQIPLGSGTVNVQGSGVPADYTVSVAGHKVPVDSHGNFAAEEILPNGTHTVEVAVLDLAGNGSLYLRDLEFKNKDVFSFAVADLTLSSSHAHGPVDQFQGTNDPQPFDSMLDGRLAFYVNGKVTNHWRLIASADTREGPVKDLFSNFLAKSPDSLFRRIDPGRYYPSFGDDGVVEEMAPTQGKFYIKAQRGENYGVWGNFKVGYTGNELAHVDRGLYGANAHFGSQATTSFAERRMAIDGFAAQPGTMPSYEEFRGTGGSLFYLRHQDILSGSERVRIEMRDKVSGIVTGVVNLRPGVDYDVDWLQGRIMLSEVLSSTGEDNLLVRSTGLSGDEAWLVARYEYTPGFDKLDEVAVGGQGHYWIGDHFRLGLTASSNEGDANSRLGAADMTLRMKRDSWFKVQAGRSQGLLSNRLSSNDGGFGFQGPDDLSFTDAQANAYRADVSVSLADFLDGRSGHFTFYKQNIDAGYSAPGQSTTKDTALFGGTLKIPITNRLSLSAKGDQKVEDLGLETRALETDFTYKLSDRWKISSGVRNDFRKDRSLLVPMTQEQGERTDAVGQVMFDPSTRWRAYGFVQDTLATSGGRAANGRVGAGGSYRLTKNFKLDGEASNGDLGLGGRVGTSFQYSERTNLYLNYSLENERNDSGQQSRRGNLVSGMKRRLSDSSSVYVEERYQDGESLTGLTHATGINLVARERWTFGGSSELGTLRDSQTGAITDRKAAGMRVGYGLDKVQLSSSFEYRRDDAQQLDLTHVQRNEWLFRNNFKVQVTPDWRVIGKLNHSFSDSSLGEFYNGGYTEAVIGYAYRPVWNDRLSALTKYTYFYNVPSTDQLGMQTSSAEFLQKSHIASFDLSYDLTSDWSIGTKYAYRLGQVSLDRLVQAFFDNAAQLEVVRVDWRFHKGWESMVEGRILGFKDIDQNRRGTLTSIYRYFGKNLKLGVGYNFTDFSDDLTDLRYNHRGLFFNFVGTR